MRFWITMAAIIAIEIYCRIHGTTFDGVSPMLSTVAGCVGAVGLVLDVFEFAKRVEKKDS